MELEEIESIIHFLIPAIIIIGGLIGGIIGKKIIDYDERYNQLNNRRIKNV